MLINENQLVLVEITAVKDFYIEAKTHDQKRVLITAEEISDFNSDLQLTKILKHIKIGKMLYVIMLYFDEEEQTWYASLKAIRPNLLKINNKKWNFNMESNFTNLKAQIDRQLKEKK